MATRFQYGDFNFEVMDSNTCMAGLSNSVYSNGPIVGSSYSGTAIIPSVAIDKSTGARYTVIKTSTYFMRDCINVTACVLPSTLKIIGWDTFFNTSIRSLIIPKSVEIIEFAGLSTMFYLESLVFEEGSKIKEIGLSAFANIINCAKIVIPPSVESMGTTLFSWASNQLTIDFVYCGSNVINTENMFQSTATINVFVTNRYPSGQTLGNVTPQRLNNTDNTCSRFYDYKNPLCTNKRNSGRFLPSFYFYIITLHSL
jgi:hypothetical protein